MTLGSPHIIVLTPDDGNGSMRYIHGKSLWVAYMSGYLGESGTSKHLEELYIRSMDASMSLRQGSFDSMHDPVNEVFGTSAFNGSGNGPSISPVKTGF